MTQIDHIRKSFFEEGRTITEIAKIFSCDRKTVRKYISVENFNQPATRLKRSPGQPKLDPFKAIIDEWLTDDLNYRRKQRHTAWRVYKRLEKEVMALIALIAPFLPTSKGKKNICTNRQIRRVSRVSANHIE